MSDEISVGQKSTGIVFALYIIILYVETFSEFMKNYDFSNILLEAASLLRRKLIASSNRSCVPSHRLTYLPCLAIL